MTRGIVIDTRDNSKLDDYGTQAAATERLKVLNAQFGPKASRKWVLVAAAVMPTRATADVLADRMRAVASKGDRIRVFQRTVRAGGAFLAVYAVVHRRPVGAIV